MKVSEFIINAVPSKIAEATKCPLDNVNHYWPIILECFTDLGIGDDATLLAALGTVAVETGHTFKPIKEFDNKEGTYLKSKAYYPYFGRGFVQITWKYNYEAYGKALGIDLVNNPDLALDGNVASSILAAYFRDHKISIPAQAGDWETVRRRVNGGLNGYDDFFACISRLKAL